MLKSPFLIILFLLAIEIAVLMAAKSKRGEKFFDFLPSVFWIYFLPMLASTFGLIDPKAPVLGAVTTYLLPMSLGLLLITVDVRAILRLGSRALVMFFIGSLGIMTGTVMVFVLFKNLVGHQFWAGFGALAASWTGGSANMIAVKEALAVPDPVFLPMVVVDTICPYIWMGLLIAAVRFQPTFDRWNHADRGVLEDLRLRVNIAPQKKDVRLTAGGLIAVVGIALVLGLLSRGIALKLPEIKDMISTYVWTIIVVSVLALGLSFSSVRRIESAGASKVGYWILYFVLTSIGAKASLSNVGSSLLLIGGGFLIILVHMIFLLIGARVMRAPLFLVAAASQANIGGVASAPVVAAVYEPGLASVGLLLAILGNIVGTYLGILVGQLCKMFA
ncbi:MAG: DUF819 family protein [Candidatus Omnitrophica bacterium]|nr:DUF819 family protein [Candidatus Omnitrophota bacterium]